MKTLGGTTLVLALLGWGCSSDDGRAPPCTTCVEPVGGTGGTVGSGGTGGAGGFGLANSGNDDECGESGSTRMVYIEVPTGGSFCIDEHEATEADYRVFKTQAGAKPAQQVPCDKNTSWESEVLDTPGYPRPNVDWCDAIAFCAFAGKRLCGKIGGGDILSETDAKDPSLDEWTYVCTNAGTTQYPYGDAFIDGRCGMKSGTGSSNPDPVLSFADCKGMAEPFSRVFDMSGNLDEWTNACDVSTGSPSSEDFCFLRGGNYFDPAAAAATNGLCVQPEDQDPNTPYDLPAKKRTETVTNTMGIRCCKDPVP